MSDGRGDLQTTFGPEDVLAYIYAVLHSPGYRARYEARLKLDFARVPLPKGVGLIRQRVMLGLALDSLEAPCEVLVGIQVRHQTRVREAVVQRGEAVQLAR